MIRSSTRELVSDAAGTVYKVSISSSGKSLRIYIFIYILTMSPCYSVWWERGRAVRNLHGMKTWREEPRTWIEVWWWRKKASSLHPFKPTPPTLRPTFPTSCPTYRLRFKLRFNSCKNFKSNYILGNVRDSKIFPWKLYYLLQ